MLAGVVEHRRHVRLAVAEAHDLVQRLVLQRLVLLDEAVQGGHVGLVVLAVMQLQRLLAHAARGQSVRRVGQGRQVEGHGMFSW